VRQRRRLRIGSAASTERHAAVASVRESRKPVEKRADAVSAVMRGKTPTAAIECRLNAQEMHR